MHNQLTQPALGSKTPLQAMEQWHKFNLELYKKQLYYLSEYDTYSILIKLVMYFYRLLTISNETLNAETVVISKNSL